MTDTHDTTIDFSLMLKKGIHIILIKKWIHIVLDPD